MPEPFTIYAHRGARGHAPENTLLAFSLAFDLGADAIEFDVQRSSDGELVVIHDDTVDRTTNGRGYVRETPFAKLRELNAGMRWNTPQRIPTLAETLALVEARGGAMNLESRPTRARTRWRPPQLSRAALADQTEPMRARILVSSFELDAVAWLKSRLPWLRVGALFSGSQWRKEDMICPRARPRRRGGPSQHQTGSARPGRTRARSRIARQRLDSQSPADDPQAAGAWRGRDLQRRARACRDRAGAFRRA